MRVLVRKMKSFGILKLQFILGAIIMAAAAIVMPLSILLVDATLFAEPALVGVVIVGVLFFCTVGYFGFVRPYILYCKLPDVELETDGEFLYIHTTKEAKVPISEIAEAYIHFELPYLYHKEFIRAFVVHLFSEEYGDIYLDLGDFGSYRMRFVSRVEQTANELTQFISDATSNV
ncbi:MAG: hypothetical protein J6Q85_05950 [Clostridia bacterium]|nr:hypothetical protein [Clostridia bacterium]